MRRKIIGAILLVAVALPLGGCGNPAGVDGNLTDNWAPMPAAKIAVPVAGACYNIETDAPASVTKWPPPVNCATSHTVETLSVGTFTGADAERGSSPVSGSSGRRTAHEICAAEVSTALGGDWRGGRLDLSLVLPIAAHWQAGARWFRCDLMEYQDLDDYKVVPRTASLKGALGGDRPVALKCFEVTEKDTKIDRMTPVGCETPHNGEFAGIFDLPDGPYPTDAAAASKSRLDGCAAVVATYTALPNDADLLDRIGWIAFPFSEVAWGLGNRGVRCYAHSSESLTSSVKDAGPGRLPVD